MSEDRVIYIKCPDMTPEELEQFRANCARVQPPPEDDEDDEGTGEILAFTDLGGNSYAILYTQG